MTEKKLGAFDAVRGLAALAVVFHHLVLAFIPGLYFAPLHPFFRVSIEGAYHVRVFFVLSGFVLSLSYFRGGGLEVLRSLALRRYFRFLTPVAASVLLAYGLMSAGLMYNAECGRLLGQPERSWLGIGNRFQPDFLEACKQIVWSTYFDNAGLQSYNNVLWTMAVELNGSFLVLSFLALFGGMRHRWLAYVVLCGILYQTLDGQGSTYCCFLVGAALCDLHVSGYRLGLLPALSLLLVGMFLGGVSRSWFAKHGLSVSVRTWIDLLSLGACFLLAGVSVSSTVQRWLSPRPLVFLGKISFPLYLVHVPVLLSAGSGVYCLLHFSLGRWWAMGAAAATTLLVSLTLAWLGALTVEPLAIWSGRVIEKWLVRRSPSQKAEPSSSVASETSEQQEPAPELVVTKTAKIVR